MLKLDTITTQLINKLSLLVIVGWTVIIVVVGFLHAHDESRLAFNSALIEAQALASQEELSRVWMAEIGGVYIPAGGFKEGFKNPGDRHPLTKQRALDGTDYSLISHIEFTRRLYQKLEEERGYRARIIRLDSNRADGIPDTWETMALQKIVAGRHSIYEKTSEDGHDYLRLIQVALTNDDCMQCHSGEFQTGQVLGGFSLKIPLKPYYATIGTYSHSILYGYLVLWVIGLVLTRLAVRLFVHQIGLAREQESQLQIVETNLHYISYFDPGSNLPNRATFDDRLRVAMAHAVRMEHMIAVAVVNIENFTQIRDLFSRNIGDQLISKVAEVVGRKIRPDDTIARMGNDRLLLLLPGLTSRENVARIINNINQAFVQTIELDGAEVHVKLSFGLAVFPDDTSEFDRLVSYAETASSRVKQQKHSNLQMYSESLNAAAHAHLQLETGLRQGLNRREFEVYYQPQIDAPSGTVIGAEALIRWNHPELGLLSPDKFIPMAENNGSIVQIGEWVLYDACSQASKWRSDYQIDFCMAVNVSARQFQDLGLTDVIDRLLEETVSDPSDLELEVTEGTVMDDVDRAIETLVDLRSRGVKVAIDDFGVGYSSFGQIKNLPFNRLKVDRSFISDIDTDRDSQVIVEMLIDLASKLNMEIIAEGVETEEQVKFLLSRGCYTMQGYYFAKPMPADEFTLFLEQTVKRPG